MPYFVILGWNFKKLLPYLISGLSKWSKRKELGKNKNPYIWDQKKPYLGIFKLQLEKAIIIFEISTLKFASKQIFVQNKKKLQMWDQIPNSLFGYFWAAVLKNYCYIWNQHSRNCQNAKFCTKIKILKFGSKNALFWNFWIVVFKSYCHSWNDYSRIYHSKLLTDTANFEIGFAFS